MKKKSITPSQILDLLEEIPSDYSSDTYESLMEDTDVVALKTMKIKIVLLWMKEMLNKLLLLHC